MTDPTASTPDELDPADPKDPEGPGALGRRHVRAGFLALAVFAAAGLALEALHAFKVPGYLDAGEETRRLLLRLAHAHGTLLGLVNVAFGLAAREHLALGPREARVASGALVASTLLLPAGFLLGGLSARGGDPGPAVLLSPLGAGLLLVALALAALRAR